MEQIKLVEGESVTYTSPRGTLIVTSHRVRMIVQTINSYSVTSITNENVSCVQISSVRNIGLLIFGIFLGLVGVIGLSNRVDFMGASIILGLIFVGLYFLLGKNMIRIFSDSGTSIDAEMTGIGKKEALDLIDLIEKEKIKRMNSIHSSQ